MCGFQYLQPLFRSRPQSITGERPLQSGNVSPRISCARTLPKGNREKCPWNTKIRNEIAAARCWPFHSAWPQLSAFQCPLDVSLHSDPAGSDPSSRWEMERLEAACPRVCSCEEAEFEPRQCGTSAIVIQLVYVVVWALCGISDLSPYPVFFLCDTSF